MIRVADYIISYLYNHGTKHIFMLTGGGAMFLDDAVASHKKIHPICQQHEQACVMAAETYSRISGNLGTALVTSGPGATNTITGVLGAWQDSTPCLIISGQAKKKQTINYSQMEGMRQLGPQEANIIPIVKSITKFSTTISDPNKIKYFLEKSIHIAKTGRPGPVWLDIPLDVQSALIDEKKLIGFNHSEIQKIKTKPTDQEIKTVIEMIKKSKKPLFIIGNGIRLSNSVKEFLKLIKLINIPVVNTILGVDVIDFDNTLYVGRGGTKGQRAANIAMQNADLIISLGARLAIPFTGHNYDEFAKNAKIIVVDIDKQEHSKNTIKIDKLIISDAKEFINKLTISIKKIKFNFSKSWAKECVALKYRYPVCLPEYTKLQSDMNMYFIVNKLSENLNKTDIIITDAGSAYYTVSQAFKIKQGQRLLIPGATGTMGYNLPASTGACIANNKKRIICITGDGSFQMNLNELITISHNKLPIKIFVFNNNGYLSIRNTQKNFFKGRLIGESDTSGVGLVNLSKIANSFNIKYFKIKNNKELIENISKILEHNGPLICELMCLKEQLIIPSVSTKQDSQGNLVSTPIDDMFPFLPEKEFNNIKEKLSNYNESI